jgi:hypothetical protein
MCEELLLFFSFNALGNNRYTHGFAQGNDSLCDGAATGIYQHVPDKRPVDLQLSQR